MTLYLPAEVEVPVWFLVLVGVAAYLLMARWWARLTWRRWMNRADEYGLHGLAVAAGIFWPLVMPIVLLVLVVSPPRDR